MATVQGALDRASGKKAKKESAKKIRLSACCGLPLQRRTCGKKGYCCSGCGFVGAENKWQQTQIDMK